MILCLRENGVKMITDKANFLCGQLTLLNKVIGIPVLYVDKEELGVEYDEHICHGTKIARIDLT